MPLFYPLGLTSIYEYLELRYGSKAVRLFAVVILVRSICVWMLIGVGNGKAYTFDR